jgi:formate-dependent nitrite reductase membrane component NrfD
MEWFSLYPMRTWRAGVLGGETELYEIIMRTTSACMGSRGGVHGVRSLILAVLVLVVDLGRPKS